MAKLDALMTSARTGDKSKDVYLTPLWLWDKLDAEFGFDVDTAASDENTLCDHWFTEEEDGLKQKWWGTTWTNPPYSEVAKWVEKAHDEVSIGRVETAVLLVAARTDTRWFWNFARWGEIRFLPGRLRFEHPNGAKHSAPFPSAVLIFRRAAYPQEKVVFWDVREPKKRGR